MPTSTAEVPAALEEVENSKKYWLKKQQDAKVSGVIPTEEAASSMPNGASKSSNKKQTMADFRVEDWPGMIFLLVLTSIPHSRPEL